MSLGGLNADTGKRVATRSFSLRLRFQCTHQCLYVYHRVASWDGRVASWDGRNELSYECLFHRDDFVFNINPHHHSGGHVVITTDTQSIYVVHHKTCFFGSVSECQHDRQGASALVQILRANLHLVWICHSVHWRHYDVVFGLGVARKSLLLQSVANDCSERDLPFEQKIDSSASGEYLPLA